MNNDFKVLLQAVIDANSIGQADVDKVQKVIDKYHLNLKTELDKAQTIAEIKKLVPQIEAELKAITGIDITINDSDLIKAYDNVIQEAIKSEQKLQKQKDDFNKKNLNAIDYEIKKREEGSKRFSDSLKAQMQERQKIIDDANNVQSSIEFGQYDSQYSSIIAKTKQWTDENEVSRISVDNLKKSFNALNQASVEYASNGSEENAEKLSNAYKEFDTQVKTVTNDIRKMNAEYAKDSAIAGLHQKVQAFYDNNKKAHKSYGEQLKEILKQTGTGAKLTTSDMDKLAASFTKISNSARQSGKLGNTFFGTMRENIKSFIPWTAGTGMVMTGIQTAKKMVSAVKELDAAQVELSKVSDLTASELAKVTDEAFEMGKTVARTGSEVLDAVTEFKRAGYEMNQSMEMANAAMIMTNVADGIKETSQAAGTLISVLKGFKMDETDIMSIVDRLNSVSNQSPVGFDDLADGLERVSGTMYQAGNSLDETLGLLTGGFAQLRNMEKVSSGLVTIGMRLRGVGEDGEEIDGLSAKLADDFGKIGVAIQDQNGNLRSTTAIVKDYAKILPKLTSEQRQYYGELAAGKRQINIWDAIVNSIEDVDNAISQSINSTGSAMQENEKFLNGIEGKVTNLKSAFENLSKDVINSNFIKGIVDLGTGLINVLDTIIDKIGVLGTAGVGLTAFLSKKNVGVA